MGVGFLIPWAGREYYSIAWPDDEARRYVPEQINDLGIVDLDASESSESVESKAEEEEIIAEPSEAAAIREYLEKHGTDTSNKAVIKAFAEAGIEITSAQVTAAKKVMAS